VHDDKLHMKKDCNMALRRAVCLVSEVGINHLLGWLLGLLGQENSLDVGQNTSLCNCNTREQLVQLLIVADSKLQVTGDDPALLVVTGSISCQLENLSCQVLHDSGKVDWCASSHSLSIVALPQVTVNTSHGELETSTAAPSLALSLCLSSFSASRHVVIRGGSKVNTNGTTRKEEPFIPAKSRLEHLAGPLLI